MLIRHKLILNTALVAVAMLVLSGLFLYSNQVSRHLTEAQRNVDGLEIAMLNLRRAEKDFLIRKDPAFVTRFNEVLANFHQLNQTLGQDDNLSAVQGELTRLINRWGLWQGLQRSGGPAADHRAGAGRRPLRAFENGGASGGRGAQAAG